MKYWYRALSPPLEEIATSHVINLARFSLFYALWSHWLKCPTICIDSVAGVRLFLVFQSTTFIRDCIWHKKSKYMTNLQNFEAVPKIRKTPRDSSLDKSCKVRWVGTFCWYTYLNQLRNTLGFGDVKRAPEEAMNAYGEHIHKDPKGDVSHVILIPGRPLEKPGRRDEWRSSPYLLEWSRRLG